MVEDGPSFVITIEKIGYLYVNVYIYMERSWSNGKAPVSSSLISLSLCTKNLCVFFYIFKLHGSKGAILARLLDSQPTFDCPSLTFLTHHKK